MLKCLHFLFLPLVLIPTCLSSCSSPRKATDSEFVRELSFETPEKNADVHLKKPITILISIDGYRWDYNSLFNPPNLTNLERTGIAARSLKPSYPAKTFPSHYTLVTGLKPTRHGIVSNEFYDPDLKKSFAVDDRANVEDSSFYLGEPIWVTAQKNGMRTASYFWIGSETAIEGFLPNSYFRFSQQISAAAEVDRILDWIKLPEDTRPHLILGYLAEVDSIGHRYGTKSNELRAAVLAVDLQIGRLRAAIQESALPINLIVVSGQGMQDLEAHKTILIDESTEVAGLLSKFEIKGRGPQMLMYLKAGESPLVKTAMRNALQNFSQGNKKPFRILMTRKELAKLQYDGSNRVGDLVLEADLPWVLGTKKNAPSTSGANHGWDSKNLSMHGIFYAEGPAFKKRGLLPILDSVNVAPLILKTLSLPEAKGLDGKSIVFKDILAPSK